MQMTAKTSWRNMKTLLGTKAMQEYREFLLKCPDIDTAAKLRNSRLTRSGLDYGILPTFRLPPKSRGRSMDESYVIDIHLDSVTTLQVHVDDTETVDETETVDTIRNDVDIPGFPKQTNISLLRETVVVADDNEVDVLLLHMIPTKETQHCLEFRGVHQMTQWM